MIPLIYDKNIFVNNIYKYALKNEDPISEVEETLSVSAGYFSRMKGNLKNVSPSVNTVSIVSQYFGKNARLLLTPFPEELTKSELKLYKMFCKLTDKTFKDQISWLPISSNVFSPTNAQNEKSNPLLSGMYDNDGNYIYDTYLSISKSCLLTKVLSAVHAMLPAIDKELHIIQVEYENDVYGYEVFLDYKPLFATTDVNVILETEVHSLYSIIEKYMKSGIVSEFGFMKIFDVFCPKEETKIAKEEKKDIIDDIDVDIPGDLSDVYPDYDDSYESYDEYLALNGID